MLIDFKILSAARGRYSTNFQLMFRVLKASHSLAFIVVMIVLFVTCGLTVSDLFAALIASMPCGWAIIQIALVCRVFLKGCRLWASVEGLSRTYEYIMGSVIFMPIYILSWFPYISEFQTRLLFSQAYSRGLQISKNSYQSDWRN
ncbi:hypothetical protein Fmac_026890 [Flemingia macrophylla]|uniref:1,3-beta-glucan synthase n=1 Tax=Flemingia macrophylla TaxID=520843 RepID=A0ABD1LG62_9FABA